MAVKALKRNIFQRIFGIPKTEKTTETNSWEYEEGILIIDLHEASELLIPGGAVRVEGKGLPIRILVVRGEDGEYRAYRNQCTHLGHRRLDPVPGTNNVQCCSVNKSTFDCCGQHVSGPARHSIDRYPVEMIQDKLFVVVSDR